MPRRWLFIVGIAVLGCKDPEKKPPPTASGVGASGSAAKPAETVAPSGPAAPSAPATPRLEETATAGSAFEAEVEDPAWAANTERAIKTAMPDLTDIDCKQRRCRATLAAASEAELVAKAEQLSSEQGLRGTSASRVLLSAPTDANGKRSMTIYVLYDR